MATPFVAMLLGAQALAPNAASGADEAPLAEPLERYRSKDLRKEVYRLKLKLVRKGPNMNDHKSGYISILRAHWRQQTEEQSETTTAPPVCEQEPERMQLASRGRSREHRLKERSPSSKLEQPRSPPSGACEPQEFQPLLPPSHSPPDHSTGSSTAAEEGVGQQDDSINNDIEMSGYASDMSFGTDNADQEPTQDPCVLTEPVADDNDFSMSSLDDYSHKATVVEDDSLSNSSSPPSTDMPTSHPEDDLDAIMKRTNYWEGRLTMSKRKIQELHGELRHAVEEEEIALLRDELKYYTRERKRAVRSLLVEPGTKI